MIRTVVAIPMALAAFSCAVAPVRASIISGTLNGASTLIATGNPGIYTQDFSGDGDDFTYGSFTPMGISIIDDSNPSAFTITHGGFLEAFSEGTLFGTDTRSETARGPGGETVTIDFVITGGTGLFAGATGEFDATVNVTAISPTTDSESGTYIGTLTLATPEPGSLILFGSAAVVVFCMRRRRTSAL